MDPLIVKLDIGPDAPGAIKAVAEMVTEIVRGQSAEFRQKVWDVWIPLLDAMKAGLKDLLEVKK